MESARSRLLMACFFTVPVECCFRFSDEISKTIVNKKMPVTITITITSGVTLADIGLGVGRGSLAYVGLGLGLGTCAVRALQNCGSYGVAPLRHCIIIFPQTVFACLAPGISNAKSRIVPHWTQSCSPRVGRPSQPTKPEGPNDGVQSLPLKCVNFCPSLPWALKVDSALACKFPQFPFAS